MLIPEKPHCIRSICNSHDEACFFSHHCPILHPLVRDSRSVLSNGRSRMRAVGPVDLLTIFLGLANKLLLLVFLPMVVSSMGCNPCSTADKSSKQGVACDHRVADSSGQANNDTAINEEKMDHGRRRQKLSLSYLRPPNRLELPEAAAATTARRVGHVMPYWPMRTKRTSHTPHEQIYGFLWVMVRVEAHGAVDGG